MSRVKREEIKELFAFISIDQDGNEAICAFKFEDNWMPLVTADKKKVKSFCQISKTIAKKSNTIVRFIKFSNPELLEEYIPAKTLYEIFEKLEKNK